MRSVRIFVAVLSLGLAFGAAAQGDGRTRDTPGAFDFYVLALSWSPAFCAGENRRSDAQCEAGRRLGFVVHGLWPQYERGFPSECDASPRMASRAALEEAADLYPSPGLARHEWRTHGTCSGLSPTAYFGEVRRARDKVKVPDEFANAATERTLTPLEIERAFATANPGLRPDMMAIACRRGVVQEMRICLDRDLRSFRSCQQVARAGCRFGDLTLPAAP